ncbi:MAG TPA: AAA family ATPase [Longimicrobium sp.]
MARILIALAGGVGSGKTSVAKALGINNNFLLLPEYMEMLATHEQLALSKKTPRERLETFLALEKVRYEIVTNSHAQHTLLDRCIWCLVAYEYARQKFDPSYLFRPSTDMLSRTDVLIPNTTFFLYTSEAIRRLRCARRVTMIEDMFYSEVFNSDTANFFRNLGRFVDVRFVDTSRQGISQIAEAIDRSLVLRPPPAVPLGWDVLTEVLKLCLT